MNPQTISRRLTGVRALVWLLMTAGCVEEEKPPTENLPETLCDGLDDDGDGLVDEGLGALPVPQHPDRDQDGFGNIEDPLVHTCLLEGYSLSTGDCDDTDPTAFPGAAEACDLTDSDCDGLDWVGSPLDLFPDHDQDGFGNIEDPLVHTCLLAGYSLTTGDCDDLDSARFPGAVERCNQRDDNCNSTVDEGLLGEPIPQYPDDDGDGFGRSEDPQTYGCLLEGWALTDGDCDDTWLHTAPGLHDFCDGVDNNCDGRIDEAPLKYLDLDQDGWGTPQVSGTACEVSGPFWKYQSGDCDDLDRFTYPGASELCDGHDRDCDGQVWEGPVSHSWFPDADGDGLGDVNAAPSYTCAPPSEGAVPLANDCDDSTPSLRGGAVPLRTDVDADGAVSAQRFGRPDCAVELASYTDWASRGYTERYAQDDDLVLTLAESRTYDDDCHMTSQAFDTDLSGTHDRIFTWNYDDLGNTILETKDYGADGHLDWVLTWDYDDAGNPLLETRDEDGDGLDDYTRTWTYDDTGELLHSEEVHVSDGTTTVFYDRSCAWSADGLWYTCTTMERGYSHLFPTQEQRWNAEGVLVWQRIDDTEYFYDDLGRLVTKVTPTGQTQYTYDEEGRLFTVESPWARMQYTYDERGNCVSYLFESFQDSTHNQYKYWTYDEQNRITHYAQYVYKAVGPEYIEWDTAFASDGSTHTEGEESMDAHDGEGNPIVIFLRTYQEDRDPEGNLLYEASQFGESYQGARTASWYDAQGNQLQMYLNLPEHKLEATFPVYDPQRGPGHVSFPGYWWSIRIQRDRAGWFYMFPGEGYMSDSDWCIDEYCEQTYFASGAPRTYVYAYTGTRHDYTWFQNGMVAYYRTIWDYPQGQDTHVGQIDRGGQLYTLNHEICSRDGDSLACTDSLTTVEWSCSP